MRSRNEMPYLNGWKIRYLGGLHSQSAVGKASALLATPERTFSA